VTDMHSMFEHAVSFDQDIGDWEVYNVKDMGSMFNDALSFNQDIRHWPVFMVTDMSYMFYDAYRFNQNLCDWRDKLNDALRVDSIFEKSNCDDRATPLFLWVDFNSWCQVCISS
jgi:Mycoplasma protein of unknown function, DUF285